MPEQETQCFRWMHLLSCLVIEKKSPYAYDTIFSIMQSLPYKLVIGCIPLYVVFKIMQKIFQELPHLIQNSSVRASLPFACASSSLDKNSLLKSIPSFHDIKWGIARFYYLFNIQLGKNHGTYVTVL